MSTGQLYKKIESLSAELGFSAVGVAAAEPLKEEITHYKEALERGDFAQMEYLSRNIDKREDPRLLVEGAKSILLFLAPYGRNRKSAERTILFPGGEIEQYKVAQYALGEDYHKVIKERLTKLLNLITEYYPNAKGRVFTDTAPLLERAWCARAGLGFIGKNNFLISTRVGIRNFIGAIITDVEISPTFNMANYKSYCGACHKCIDSCPTAALSPYKIDASRCISYLTIEKKDSNILLNKALAKERDGWIFGCDACMNCCPWNSRNCDGWEEFMAKEEPIDATHLRRR